MTRRPFARRLAAAMTATMAAALALAAGPTSVFASNGTSATHVTIVGDTELEYGEPITMIGTVDDESDSCRSSPIPSCDFPSGRIDFYAFAGAVQTFLKSADLSIDLQAPQGFFRSTTDEVQFCCLAIGSYDGIRAYYVPGTFEPGSADSGPVSVERNGSTVTLQASPTDATVGQAIQFDVHVGADSNEPGAIKPTGAVDIYEGPTIYGTVFIDADGDATLITSQIPLGQHDLRARWGGDEHWDREHLRSAPRDRRWRDHRDDDRRVDHVRSPTARR
jgi:hypothetical protein